MNSLSVKLILQAVDRMTSPIRSMTNRLSGFFRQINQAIASVGRATLELGKSLQNIGGGLTARLTTTIGGLGFAAIKTAAQFEDLKSMLETATGSIEGANIAWEMLTNFAKTTPYELTEVVGAFIKLKNLGLDPTAAALRSYGNTASATGKGLDQFIEAIADATTFQFERLREFGIVARQEGNKVAFTFANQTKVVEKNAGAIEGYLRAIGDEKFPTAMDKKMQNVNGHLSNFQGALANVLAKLGTDLIRELSVIKAIDDFALTLERLLDIFKSLSPWMQSFIIWSGLVLSVLGPVIMGFGQLVLGLGFTAVGFSKLGSVIAWFYGTILFRLIPALWAASAAVVNLGLAFMATPLGWITAGITALAVAGYLIITNWEAVKKFWTDLWDGMKKTVSDAVDYLRPLIDWVSSALNTVVDAGVQVGNFVTDNAVTRGVGDFFGYSGQTTQSGSAVPVTSPLLTQNLNAGGTIDIKINSEARPSVVRVKPADNRMNYNVDTGLIMGGAW